MIDVWVCTDNPEETVSFSDLRLAAHFAVTLPESELVLVVDGREVEVDLDPLLSAMRSALLRRACSPHLNEGAAPLNPSTGERLLA